jgi:hypothetical protein
MAGVCVGGTGTAFAMGISRQTQSALASRALAARGCSTAFARSAGKCAEHFPICACSSPGDRANDDRADFSRSSGHANIPFLLSRLSPFFG